MSTFFLLGLATGGVITRKWFEYGCVNNNEKEVANTSLAVYGAAIEARMALRQPLVLDAVVALLHPGSE